MKMLQFRFLVEQFIKRNTALLKRTSSGNDLVVYCDHTKHQWNPELFKTKGFGGSEEAVINLTRALAKLNWKITVYNNCGHKPIVDAGVTYRPSWEFNPRDKQDVIILWRVTKPLDWNLHADRIFVDLHDAVPERSFTKRSRIDKITRIFVKSPFHRSMLRNISDDKLAVIPNGIDFHLLDTHEPKDPHLLINTSSADRSMDVLPKLFKEVKRRVPQARLQWAYGWDNFELFNADNADKIRWMHQTRKDMDEAGIETLGHLTQTDVGKLYQRGAIFAYPTEFPEIDCISAKKAQACGCVPVTTDFGALSDSVQFGVKIPSPEWNPSKPARSFHFGVQNPESQRLWVEAVVDLLTNPTKRAELAVKGAIWARQFVWPEIAARWNAILRS